MPLDTDALLAKMREGDLGQHLQGFVTEDTCLTKLAEPAALGAMPEGAKFEIAPPNPPAGATTSDSSVGGFQRFASWLEGLATPAGGRLVFARLIDLDAAHQVGWAAYCVEQAPVIRVDDWRRLKSKEPGKVNLGLTDEGLKRIAALGPTKQTMIFVLDERDIVTTASVDALRSTKAPVLTFTVESATK